MIHYIRLIRPLNLFVLALAMLLFRFMIVDVYTYLPEAGGWTSYYMIYDFKPYLSVSAFFVLLVTTLLVAAGGYVINDIMDVETDRINRPEKLIVEKHIPEDIAFKFYKILVALSIVSSITLMFMSGQYKISGIPLIVMVLMYLYAQIFKRMTFVGNFIVSVCAALPILLIAVYEFKINEFDTAIVITLTRGIGLAAAFYGLFALLTTLIREIIKDIEDVEGDLAIEARTLPIEFGQFAAKIMVLVLQLLTLGLLTFPGLYLLTIRASKPFYGFVILMILPLLVQIIAVLIAKTPIQFRRASTIGKVHMLLGVLSMVYFSTGFAPHFFNQLVNHIAIWLQ